MCTHTVSKMQLFKGSAICNHGEKHLRVCAGDFKRFHQFRFQISCCESFDSSFYFAMKRRKDYLCLFKSWAFGAAECMPTHFISKCLQCMHANIRFWVCVDVCLYLSVFVLSAALPSISQMWFWVERMERCSLVKRMDVFLETVYLSKCHPSGLSIIWCLNQHSSKVLQSSNTQSHLLLQYTAMRKTLDVCLWYEGPVFVWMDLTPEQMGHGYVVVCLLLGDF